MKKGIVTILLLAFTSMVHAAGDPVKGEEKALVCAACHGKGGVSSNPEWPSLAGQGQKYLEKQLHDFRNDFRKNIVMKPQASLLSDEDIKNVAAYYSAQKMPVQETTLSEDSELLKIGEALYRGGDLGKGIPACSACHGPTGQGIAPAAFPALAGQQVKYTRTQLDAFKNAAMIEQFASDTDLKTIVMRDNDPNMMMRDIAAKLTPKQIEALALYIQGLH